MSETHLEYDTLYVFETEDPATIAAVLALVYAAPCPALPVREVGLFGDHGVPPYVLVLAAN